MPITNLKILIYENFVAAGRRTRKGYEEEIKTVKRLPVLLC
jgi:hypothetical protein